MLIHYDMPLWRPPSESSSIIIQLTLGCSYNHCSFCSMYTDKHFRSRSLTDICQDIDIAASSKLKIKRVFLADGDAMVLTTNYLHKILDYLHIRFPSITQVSSYTTVDNLNRKSSEELVTLRARKLSLLYLGVESGHANILKCIHKGVSPSGIARAIRKATAAGLTISCMIILGIGGREYTEQHIAATITLLNKTPPTYLSTLQLTLDRAQIPDFFQSWRKHGIEFQPLGDNEYLNEMAQLVTTFEPTRPVIFRSNHVSNILSLKGILPRDRTQLLTTITDNFRI